MHVGYDRITRMAIKSMVSLDRLEDIRTTLAESPYGSDGHNNRQYGVFDRKHTLVEPPAGPPPAKFMERPTYPVSDPPYSEIGDTDKEGPPSVTTRAGGKFQPGPFFPTRSSINGAVVHMVAASALPMM